LSEAIAPMQPVDLPVISLIYMIPEYAKQNGTHYAEDAT
jgi:hypothetical protein